MTNARPSMFFEEPTVVVHMPEPPEPTPEPIVVQPDSSDAIGVLSDRFGSLEDSVRDLHTRIGGHVHRDELQAYAHVDHTHPEYVTRGDLDERVPYDSEEMKIEPPEPEPVPEEEDASLLEKIDDNHDKRLKIRLW